MYRAPDVTVRCAACGGTSVTPPTMMAAGDQPVSVYFASGVNGKTTKSEHFHVDRARICLDCGHVMLTMSAENMTLLRMLAPALRPYP